MKVLVVAPCYPPEIVGGAHLTYEFVLSLKARGHEVTVLTAYPSYNIKKVPPQYRRGLCMNEMLDGIPVRRIRVPNLPRDNKIARGMQHVIYGLWLSLMTLFAQKGDVVLVYSPPLPLPWLACWIGRMWRMPVVVNIQDLFPREAVELGMMTNSILIRMFEAMERQIYRMASAMTVHSTGNREHIIKLGGKPESVHVVFNWVDLERIRPGNSDNGFRRQYGLGNHFVVSYAGTMGWAQDMDTIIASANYLRNNHSIMFLLVGEGVEKDNAKAKSQKLGLENILWLPMQPWSVYPKILTASNVSLINLHPELRTPVVPSKLLSIMASARPVIASIPAESDARLIVEDAGCGICVDAGKGEALTNAILKLESNRALAHVMGKRGRAYVEKHFSRESCTLKFENVLKNVVGDAQ